MHLVEVLVQNFISISKHLVKGKIPLNISLVELAAMRGTSSDGRGVALHVRGGG